MTPNALPDRRRLMALALVVAILVALACTASTGAFGNDRGGPKTSKATSVKKQLKQLTKRIAALEQKKFPDSVPPSGPARGDLAGSYPNPSIAPNAVGPGKIPDETLSGFEIAPDSLYANDLAAGSVGASELKGLHVVVSAGAQVSAGDSTYTNVACPSNEVVTGGGFAWGTDQPGTAIISSSPAQGSRHIWDVVGRSASANTIYAWALCLPA